MRVSYGQAASDDVVRQFRYYLVTLNLPEVAVRFRDAVRLTIKSLLRHPLVGPGLHSSNPQLKNLRTWPVAGFEAIRIYYLLENLGTFAKLPQRRQPVNRVNVPRFRVLFPLPQKDWRKIP